MPVLPVKAPHGTFWACANLLLLAGHPWLVTHLPGLLASFFVNLVLLVLPASGWLAAWTRRERRPGMDLARHVLLSTFAFLVVLVGFRMSGRVPSQLGTWTGLWAITNAGFLASRRARAHDADAASWVWRDVGVAGALFGGAYVLFFVGATRVVPPLYDHDLEVQATGYGLLSRFEPLLLTDRGSVYYFAHPPLLHLWVGGSFLLHGSFDALETFDASSRRARDVRAGLPVEPPAGVVTIDSTGVAWHVAGRDNATYQLVGDNGATTRLPVDSVELRLIIANRFRQHPHRLETRTPNVFFGAAAVALIGAWAGRITRRRWLGVWVGIAYASNPEVLVRSSYGGYFAAGSLLIVLMLLAVERWPGERRRHDALAMSIGALGALVDHKVVLLPASMAAFGALQALRAQKEVWRSFLHPVFVGFLTGMLLFWIYGLAIEPTAFITDHLRHHVLDRVLHHNPLGYSGYATPTGLWLELLSHSGWIVLPASLYLMVSEVRSGTRPSRLTNAFWLFWCTASGIAFTVVDWRMTKHIAPLLVVFYLGLAPSASAVTSRVAFACGVIAISIGWNSRQLLTLARDFAAFQITPGW